MNLRTALAPVFTGELREDPYTRHLYSSDASMYAIEPLAVAFPRHAGDVAALVAVCAELGVPVLPRGAGTSLAGQTVGRAVVVDFSRHMNRILDIDAGAMRARVQPGVVQDQLNRAAARHGLMFGPDTSTSNRATIGGMIGNNSAGSHSIRYGSTIDHVETLDVVLADAGTARFGPDGGDDRLHRGTREIIESLGDGLAGFPPFWRHSGGYRLDRVLDGGTTNLAKLVAGSEGTLAVVTEAEVRLVPRPRARAIAVGHFTATTAAVAATRDALERDAASVELMDRTILDLSRQRVEYAGLGGILSGDPHALLFVEFFGDDEDEVAARVDDLAAAWQAGGHGYHTLRAVTAQQQAAVLKVRKASLGLLMASSTGTRRPLAFVEDTAVPPDTLVPYVEEFAAVLARHDLKAGFYGHCSVGCLHIRPFVDLREPAQVSAMRAVAEEIAALAARYGGVNSSEHGDGLARSEFNRRLFGDRVYEAMRRVKRLFDPEGRLNPGKIVDAGPMTEHLRDPALPAAPPLRTTLAFADGMRGAADRCMNIGVCRKEDTGVMCPSYMATRDEEHSTRGRANALVKALSSADPRAALGDERLHGILDLCLECKACTSECPLGVDMASLKSEFLHQYQEIHGTPRRSRLFASIRRLNRLGSAAAPVSNWIAGAAPVRALLDRALGISRRRPLPAFHRETLARWFARRTPPAGPFPRGDLVLLADSFTSYGEPAIGRAAVELLELAGWRVLLTEGCCGRAAVSKGLLDQARASARAMVTLLAPYAERGVPIVGIEPSCLLTLRQEYAALLSGDERVRMVAAQARLIATPLLEAIDDGGLVLRGTGETTSVLLHGHCHEKAGVGTEATRALLARLPGAEVTELDAGCCGMAGSFGFESEHYDLSMKIGGLRLFPAVAETTPGTLIAATGVSCRQQIAHGTGRTAQHPVQLVRAAVVPPGEVHPAH
ncbi:oxidoreductase [Microtetraspora sp. NBRC 13810]|uniref:FAD-binding and (Fe-S)-binding domain-containing protein n=1 Tax=Microtetraspora sp. NBRC 13810 TaxID=3030990 RepID=UPI0024A311D4|nr:FAD-binding and (Fe-S)-binding domain-containing protein [Microtetraspora sp. NBRC 13810]GLW05953.1 oxidoreductase [Microtetraspora sp. NBRC 13810]